MGAPPGLAPYGRGYVWGVIAVGAYLIGTSVGDLYLHPLPWQGLLLAALTLISGSATVKLPSIPASISISETFVFTAVLLYGSAAGTVIVALDGLVISFWISKRRREFHRALFNTAAPAVSAWFSSRLFFLVAGIAPLGVAPASLGRTLPALVLFATAYFGLNSWLITLAVVAETRLNALRVWQQNFLWLSLNYFFGASVAFLLVSQNIGIRYIGVTVPLMLVLYFTFKTSMARVEDANKHVEKVNQLYLSTIETLAMAIDAKDQITHGHIRRVQEYAVGLARHVGIKDDLLIKAIEAAALLHDMGKLAVPEYILNKPGKLTPAEFEKMKLHASVGADILSAIDFPYPVVPIVRHHHEYWNGGGYPDGIKGTAIPIGARILAIVDCFDALTSDRPYRPRLSDAEALRIVVDRRGTMYDPLIVDTFTKIYKQIGPTPDALAPATPALAELAMSPRALSAIAAGPTLGLDGISASSGEVLTMYELSQALSGAVNLMEAGGLIANHLRRLVPSALCVLYLCESATDELEASYAAGDIASSVKGLRITFGQRLSGWVAANRQTIINSDPTLDFGEMARAASPRLRSCLSTPLIADEHVVGVLALYSSQNDGFTEDHRRIVEAVAQHVSHTIKRVAEVEGATTHDPLTGLPDTRQLEEILGEEENTSQRFFTPMTLILIDVVDLKRIHADHGRRGENEALRHVADCVRRELGMGETLYRYGSDEFVALSKTSDVEAVAGVAVRIRETVASNPLTLRSGVVTIKVTTTVINDAEGHKRLRDLIGIARQRSSRSRGHDYGPSVH